MISRFTLSGFLIFLCVSSSAALAAQNERMKNIEVEQAEVLNWNRFSDNLLEMHKWQISGRDIRKTEVKGQYGGQAAQKYTYKEISYFDKQSGRLLSRVRWDGEKPELHQIIEVFVYDTNGRLERDFASIYLPWSRNAPIRTYITLHSYANGLHAIRQFDASDNRVYEKCEGRLSGGLVKISLNAEEIAVLDSPGKKYTACFDSLPETAGKYLNPH